MGEIHTPAPWEAVQYLRFDWVEVHHKGETICTISTLNPNYKADADVIASAPNLLKERDALKVINAELVRVLRDIKQGAASSPEWYHMAAERALEQYEAQQEGVDRPTTRPPNVGDNHMFDAVMAQLEKDK